MHGDSLLSTRSEAMVTHTFKEAAVSRDITPFALRMPPDLRARVDGAAKANKRSLNAEIVARLEESFAPEVHRFIRAVEPATNAGGPELDELLMNVEIVLEQMKMFTGNKKQ